MLFTLWIELMYLCVRACVCICVRTGQKVTQTVARVRPPLCTSLCIMSVPLWPTSSGHSLLNSAPLPVSLSFYFIASLCFNCSIHCLSFLLLKRVQAFERLTHQWTLLVGDEKRSTFLCLTFSSLLLCRLNGMQKTCVRPLKGHDLHRFLFVFNCAPNAL